MAHWLQLLEAPAIPFGRRDEETFGTSARSWLVSCIWATSRTLKRMKVCWAGLEGVDLDPLGLWPNFRRAREPSRIGL